MTRTRLPLPEPVDYQIRLAGGRWTHCAKHIHEAAIKSGAAETRKWGDESRAAKDEHVALFCQITAASVEKLEVRHHE